MSSVTPTLYDCTGRLIKAGDIIKIFHFREYRRRRKIFMYKLVCRVNDKLEIDPNGKYLYAVGIEDIFRTGSLDKAHKCPLRVIEDCEIIGGGTVQGGDLFWERPRIDKMSAAGYNNSSP